MADVSVLTERQREIYSFIRTTIESRGFAPAIREIGEHFGIKSPNGVMCHLKALEKKGLINRFNDLARAIQLTDMAKPGARPGLPFLGRVAAGPPIEAIENAERVDFTGNYDDSKHFVLEVRGNSMIEDHIQDGDFVVIRNDPEPPNGSTVVAVIDGDATLKRLYRRPDYLELRPANGTMDPIRVTADKQVEIKGVLAGVFRKCPC
jgi:repressor LexA